MDSHISLPKFTDSHPAFSTKLTPRYRPDGQGGVINIVLKKNTKLGFNGSVNANAGNDDRYNGSLFLNYHPKKLNIFGSYSARKDDRRRTSTNIRNERLTSEYFSDKIVSVLRPFSNTVNGGVDFTPNDKNRLGVSGNYFMWTTRKHDVTTKIINSVSLDQNYDRTMANEEEGIEQGATIYFEHDFKSEGHSIRLETNVMHSPTKEDNQYINSFRHPFRVDSLENILIKRGSDDKQIALSYENQINDHSQMELGFDGQFNKKDQDFHLEAFNSGQGRFITDLTKTNRFIYHEEISALYGFYSLLWKIRLKNWCPCRILEY